MAKQKKNKPTKKPKSNKIAPNFLRAFGDFASKNTSNGGIQNMLLGILNDFITPQPDPVDAFDQQARGSILARLLDEDNIDSDMVNNVISGAPLDSIFGTGQSTSNQVGQLGSELQDLIERKTVSGDSSTANSLAQLSPASFAELKNFKPRSASELKKSSRRKLPASALLGPIGGIFDSYRTIKSEFDPKSDEDQFMDELDRLVSSQQNINGAT